MECQIKTLCDLNFASTATSIPRSGMRGAGRSSRWRRSSATSQGRHPINRKHRETARWCERNGRSARGDEHDRASTYQTNNSRRSPPASHASHDYAVLAPLRDRLAFVQLRGSPRGKGPGPRWA